MDVAEKSFEGAAFEKPVELFVVFGEVVADGQQGLGGGHVDAAADRDSLWETAK